jgi:hypothetical protein
MISSRAEYRTTDYRFARTQSRGLSQLEWESRAPSLKAWGNYIAAAVACALLGLLALGWR